MEKKKIFLKKKPNWKISNPKMAEGVKCREKAQKTAKPLIFESPPMSAEGAISLEGSTYRNGHRGNK